MVCTHPGGLLHMGSRVGCRSLSPPAPCVGSCASWPHSALAPPMVFVSSRATRISWTLLESLLGQVRACSERCVAHVSMFNVDSCTWHCRCSTEGTPYEGGYFRVKFQFTEEFPAVPPKCLLCGWCHRYMKPHSNTTTFRYYDDEDIPSQCVQIWRDLCQHTKEGLEARVWYCAYPCHGTCAPICATASGVGLNTPFIAPLARFAAS